MTYRQTPTLETLTEAIAWAEKRWVNQQTAPMRLHESRTMEGQLGPPFAAAFITALDGREDAVEKVRVSVACKHPGKNGGLCPMCAIYDEQGKPIVESGVYTKTVTRNRYPMTIALRRLSNALQPAQERRSHPHPYRLVLELATHDWTAMSAARSLNLPWDLAEALFLKALRQLHLWYQEAPIPSVSWVDKSDAQQNAEQETWTAA